MLATRSREAKHSALRARAPQRHQRRVR
jgi:hypothetical protein